MSLPIRRARIENTGAHDAKGADYVAPHAGNENWNLQIKEEYIIFLISLPRQGARIEIDDDYKGMTFDIIAPPHGGRELKSDDIDGLGGQTESLPTQGARIEIKCFWGCRVRVYIAPHAGSENWNRIEKGALDVNDPHYSPRKGRELKWETKYSLRSK